MYHCSSCYYRVVPNGNSGNYDDPWHDPDVVLNFDMHGLCWINPLQISRCWYDLMSGNDTARSHGRAVAYFNAHRIRLIENNPFSDKYIAPQAEPSPAIERGAELCDGAHICETPGKYHSPHARDHRHIALGLASKMWHRSALIASPTYSASRALALPQLSEAQRPPSSDRRKSSARPLWARRPHQIRTTITSMPEMRIGAMRISHT